MLARRLALFVFLLAAVGCGSHASTTGPVSVADTDSGKVRTADVSILFIGNSHTSSAGLPDLVCEMIRFGRPGRTAYARVLMVGHLEALAADPTADKELEAHPWKVVVLQAQKISVSGKVEYPRDDGINFAKRAKERGAKVFFFSEWGLKDDPTNGPRHEKVYTEMAAATGAEVAAVGRAWDLALAERPELPLHEFDGNHQSRVGAFLTACVLVGRITGEDPTGLGAFPDPHTPEADRAFLARIAAKSLAGK